MLRQLLESRPLHTRTRGAAFFSLVFHTAIVGTAVGATMRVAEPIVTDPALPPIIFVDPTTRIPTRVERPVDRATAHPSEPSPVDIVVPPIDVPIELPPVPAPGSPLVERTIGSPSHPVIPGTGEPGTATGPLTGSGPLWSDEVERPVRPIGTLRPPRYPDVLRRERTEGAVVATFVVDSLGRVEPESFRALSTTHPLFEQAVRSAVLGMRFRAAEARGGRVRQLVQQRFVFTLVR